jgi:hypothetical protein
LRQGYPLSPYLFLLIADGLSRAIKSTKRANIVQGMRLGRSEILTHLLFVDDVVFLCYCGENEAQTIEDILELFCDPSGMVINICKSVVYFLEVDDDIKQYIVGLFNFTSHDMHASLKYLRFSLQPNNYTLMN